MKTEPNTTANPLVITKKSTDKGIVLEQDVHTGLTKREHFASLALQSILSNSSDRGETAAANMAVKFADELINALNR